MVLTFAMALELHRWLADLLYFEKNIIHSEDRTREMNIVLSIYPLRPGYLLLLFIFLYLLYIFCFRDLTYPLNLTPAWTGKA